MNKHLINKAADWFDDVEKWNSFLELCDAKDSIKARWLEGATDELRKYFVLNPSFGWDFSAWGCVEEVLPVGMRLPPPPLHTEQASVLL